MFICHLNTSVSDEMARGRCLSAGKAAKHIKIQLKVQTAICHLLHFPKLSGRLVFSRPVLAPRPHVWHRYLRVMFCFKFEAAMVGGHLHRMNKCQCLRWCKHCSVHGYLSMSTGVGDARVSSLSISSPTSHFCASSTESAAQWEKKDSLLKDVFVKTPVDLVILHR